MFMRMLALIVDILVCVLGSLGIPTRSPHVANHVKNFWCGVHDFQADVRMTIMKDPKDFICKSLPNHFYACEIKHSNLELADPREDSFCL